MKRKLKFVLFSIMVVVLVMAVMGMAKPNKLLTLKQLNQTWNAHMVKGESALSINGIPVNQPVNSKCRGERDIEGYVSRALYPSSCIVSISVGENRKKVFGVFGSGGGWSLRGGLLKFIELGQARFELYGKEINRLRPGIFDNHYKRRDTMFEFFLLRRDNGTDEAVILKKWEFQPEQVPDLKSIELHKTVLGFLTRDNDNTLRVSIVGVSNPVDETIAIDNIVSQNR